ncbi:MAG TPA: hypothetical protein VFA04_05240 [Bryobacteraceae bacterium]|nr:hypothetical protein [Bryobacteraceae bacterium]
MATGFLDAYEQQAERQYRRAQLLKRAISVLLIAGGAAAIGYFSLRTRSQERVLQQFLADLEAQKYQEAYRLWGCTQETPCKYYPPEKFAEDWGPNSLHANPSAIKIEHVDFCSDGVVFDLAYPNSEDIGLWVERSNNVISFAPWPRCPGRHLQLGAFLKSLFS